MRTLRTIFFKLVVVILDGDRRNATVMRRVVLSIPVDNMRKCVAEPTRILILNVFVLEYTSTLLSANLLSRNKSMSIFEVVTGIRKLAPGSIPYDIDQAKFLIFWRRLNNNTTYGNFLINVRKNTSNRRLLTQWSKPRSHGLQLGVHQQNKNRHPITKNKKHLFW